MEIRKSRRIISVFVIVAMVASIFAIPVLSGGNDVEAAAKKYTVKHNRNGGKFTAKKYASKKTVTSKVKAGKNKGYGPKVKRTGYKFKGWFTKKKGGKRYMPGTNMKKSLTFYARWAARKYIVSFDTQGGSFVAAKNVTFKKTYGKLPTPIRDGYTFLGWYTTPRAGETDKGGTQVTSTTKYKTAKNTTLYARWQLGGSTEVPSTEKELNAGDPATYLGRSLDELNAVGLSIDTSTRYFISIGNLYERYGGSDSSTYVFKNGKCVFYSGLLSQFSNQVTTATTKDGLDQLYGYPERLYPAGSTVFLQYDFGDFYLAADFYSETGNIVPSTSPFVSSITYPDLAATEIFGGN